MSVDNAEHPQHANYPHVPGALYDCAACESGCHCDYLNTPCVFCAIQAEGTERWTK